MEIVELKGLIKTNNIPNFLIFTGEEYAVQKIYINQIAKVKQLDTIYADSITDIWQNLGSKSFLSKSYCYIIRDDKELVSNEKLQTELQNRLKSDIVILMLTSVDKRTKLYKTYKDSIIEFNVLKSEMVKRYIQKEIDLSDKNCDKLIEVCEGSYSRCLLEIDKIKRFGGNCNQAFEQLLEDGTIHQPPQDAIFDFVKAVLQNKPRTAYRLLQNCYAIGESNLVILSVLFNSTKQLLQVQTCQVKDIEKNTGLSWWQINNARECLRINSDNKLMFIMKLIQSTERKIKSGLIEESVAVDYVVSNIL